MDESENSPSASKPPAAASEQHSAAANEPPLLLPPSEGELIRDEADSALGSDDEASETTSLASSILHHREQWGRTYHKFRADVNEYWGPNDEQQNDALDIGHHMLTLVLDGKLFLAPVDTDTCRRVIDVGTGTGIWAIDMADQFPEAEVHGIDLSPIQPNWVPPNCLFAIDDVEDEWTFKPNYFDFVHIRCLMGSISDWPALYKQAYKHMVPGGWIQHLDIDIRFRSDDGSVGEDHIMAEFSRIFLDIGVKTGKTFEAAANAARLIRDTGFTDVHEQWFKIPIGTWVKDPKMKQIGTYCYYYCLEGCDGWSLFLLNRVLQWSPEKIQVFLSKLKNAFKDPKVNSYFLICVVYGRKPVASST